MEYVEKSLYVPRGTRFSYETVQWKIEIALQLLMEGLHIEFQQHLWNRKESHYDYVN